LKRVTANLQGGLGNQLFILFASYNIALQHNAVLILDKTLMPRSDNKRLDYIEGIEIKFGESHLLYGVKEFNKTQITLLMERAVYKLLSRREVFARFLKQYRSRVFGFDPNIFLLKPSVALTGYFQTYRYVNDIVSNYGVVSIKQSSPSLWFKTLEDQILNSTNSVAIHVRRGDYADHKNTLGMLADEYFLTALRHVQELTTINRVFIFSDSVPAANLLKAQIMDLDCIVVTPPKDSSPLESMLLMSKCGFRIISNSTFSWWSGYLGLGQEKVVAPFPWYRNHEEPEFLVPLEWKRIDSIWVD